MTEQDIAVETLALSKHYGAVKALDAVDVRIDSGQYFVLLGPSGGGKTTLLRLIGGFVRPTEGRVLLHGQDVSDLPPNLRPTAMVFQSYALFPHMTVDRNVGYGLRLRKLPRAEIERQVGKMLALVGLQGLAGRMPHELSGGQQQRVQLARALVLEADILLLDEPLAALDAKLRKDMCLELKRIQEQVGITFIHVTHNQEEAMTVADRIALIADGKLVEEGSPREIYQRPRKRFTADFVGETNIFDGTVAATNGSRATVDLGFAGVDVLAGQSDLQTGTTVAVSIRSEMLTLHDAAPAGDDWQSMPARYLTEIYLGLTTAHRLQLPNEAEVVVQDLSHGERPAFAAGQPLFLAWRTGNACLHTD